MKDVAKEANVSISTVSNVLTGKKPVSADLQKRVELAIKKLNYTVNPMASGLKSTRTNTLGVILPNISRIFFPEVLKGIQDNARKHNFTLIYFDTDEEPEKEMKYINEMQNNMVDGIIIDFCRDINNDKNMIKFLESIIKNERKNVPIVALEKKVDSDYISSVSIDNYESAYKLTEHLIDLGHSKIGHISGPKSYPTVPQRLAGYRDALEDYTLLNEDLVLNGDFRPVSGYELMKSIIKDKKEFTAMFVANDQMAIGAMKALLEEDIHIPDDVAIVGFDNIFASSIVSPSLSTINVPRYQIGWEAVSKIQDQIMKNAIQKEDIVLPTNLVVRRSTDSKADDIWELEGW